MHDGRAEENAERYACPQLCMRSLQERSQGQKNVLPECGTNQSGGLRRGRRAENDQEPLEPLALLGFIMIERKRRQQSRQFPSGSGLLQPVPVSPKNLLEKLGL